MLPYLHQTTPFPSVDEALDEPNGLLAAGGDLSASRLIDAYEKGIFPWFSEGEPILWWSPNPRTVFNIEDFKVHKSVKQTIRRQALTITLNKDFSQVIHQCSLPRSEDNGTWITEEMCQAYITLHQLGRAHSVEVWQKNNLVGGIYGINVGKVFCGESMFSGISNGSKVALSALVCYLKPLGYQLIDCQIENPHLMSLGAKNILRANYIQVLNSLSGTNNNVVQNKNIWSSKTLNVL